MIFSSQLFSFQSNGITFQSQPLPGLKTHFQHDMSQGSHPKDPSFDVSNKFEDCGTYIFCLTDGS